MTLDNRAPSPLRTGTKFSEWHEQWSMFEDHVDFLFYDWIKPHTLASFTGKDVLECGCGGGQHTALLAPAAKSVMAVDLNTTDIARERNKQFSNVTFLEDDLATMDVGRQFDIVLCIGVIHHTDDPDATFRNLYRHCRPGGLMIIWTYSAEGNAMVRYGVEPIRKLVLRHLSRKTLNVIAWIVTAALYPIIHTVYRIPALRFLPYYEYFANARRLSFERNQLNVFDKLNAPQTIFTTRAKCSEWFTPTLFEPDSISILPYAGVSYSLSGIKR
jgi:2-polyprenyl-3-methyl-5-hydroxy-6-metoxy-1,4-benzoquinol methylase